MSAALAVGTFDGIHLGHRAVLHALTRRAAQASLPPTVVTFEPHPLEVLRPGSAPDLLTSRAEKIALLAELGIERVHVLRFTAEFARLEARAFVRELLVGRLGCRELVAGEDHRFGRERAGGLGELRELARELGLGLEVVPRVEVEGAPVSSTRVRHALAAGDLELAARLLGRRYGVFAQVVRGAGRGAALGFPTVNLALDARKQMPPEGIYACRATVRGGAVPAAAHWGSRPTFGEEARVLEAHLLGQGGELYGEWLDLVFLERLRDIVRFDGGEALARAMAEDLRRAAEVYVERAGADSPPPAARGPRALQLGEHR